MTVAYAQVEPGVAKQWFAEVTKLCEREAGRLWGKSLCGPMVIVDAATRTRATSQPEPAGTLPRFPAYADGPVAWGGTVWFSWPLYMLAGKTAAERQQVLLHGLFHRIQADLGFTPSNGQNEHLDTLEGRYWMQMEWRALRRALESTATPRVEAIADALAFRRERRRIFPTAAENECREEIKEGLPTYTAVAAWADNPKQAREAAFPPNQVEASLVGSFAYISGAPYGLLLDDLRPGWRREVKSTSDLGDLLATAASNPPIPDLAKAASRYNGAELRTSEETRDRERQARIAELRHRFVEGPVLTMPAAGSRTSDSTGAAGIPGAGTVYFNNFALTAPWGRLTATKGVLLGTGETISVPITAPLEGTTLQGDGWTAALNPGWVVRPAPRQGSFQIVREP